MARLTSMRVGRGRADPRASDRAVRRLIGRPLPWQCIRHSQGRSGDLSGRARPAVRAKRVWAAGGRQTCSQKLRVSRPSGTRFEARPRFHENALLLVAGREDHPADDDASCAAGEKEDASELRGLGLLSGVQGCGNGVQFEWLFRHAFRGGGCVRGIHIPARSCVLLEGVAREVCRYRVAVPSTLGELPHARCAVWVSSPAPGVLRTLGRDRWYGLLARDPEGDARPVGHPPVGVAEQSHQSGYE